MAQIARKEYLRKQGLPSTGMPGSRRCVLNQLPNVDQRNPVISTEI